MFLLMAVTLLWAFSFSLIGVYLAGQVDSWCSVLIRIGLAAIVFLPFIRLKSVTPKLALQLMAIGAIQLGLMYGFYFPSFIYLSVPEVLLFTVLTPLYITLINDLLERRFNFRFLVSALIAVVGAVTIRYHHINAHFLTGLIYVQGSNICFAIGQISYKRLMAKQTHSFPQQAVFGWFFIGALAVALIGYLFWGDHSRYPTTAVQWGILIYLGTVASGLGYFLWNKGATQVNVGFLAIANNLLIPAGIIVNLVIWNHNADLLRLAIGGVIMLLALYVNKKWPQPAL